jgi:dTDP-4-amino-4,6-dideoxygalactose transaminase
MTKELGGRGKKAPYISTHVRIPEPIKYRVENLKQLYLDGQLEYIDECLASDHKLANEYRAFLDNNDDLTLSINNSLTSLDSAVESAKNLLKQKKSARETVAKLLSIIYGADIKVDDLKV